MALARCFLDT